MTPLDNATTQNDYNQLRRRQSPRRVHFNDQSSRSPSPARRRSNYYNDRRQQPPAPHATNHISRQSVSSSSCSIAGQADQIIILKFIAATHRPAVGGIRTTHR